ncbi:cytochrome P450 [Paenibacillus chitinolyticus]|uniref:cytochrome P450 n=1 Tax=Paenibacillus chitinolyticus TaxID=79263 RepID=UPI002DB7F49E|nr:cytochrome P450 [Paenibacillus chitinolyticus]MEC0244298.1 cytochrome P450 [Paenibacillus chitinolyticus]
MYKEVVSIQDITGFKTRAEEFFPLHWYRRMLSDAPVYYHEGTDTWNVFRYDDVKQVISNSEYFSSEGTRTTIAVGADNKEGSIPAKVNISSVDPPQHQKNRSLLSAAFTPRSLKNWEPRIRHIVQLLLDNMEPHSTVDIVQSLSGPLPSMVMSDLLGIPLQDSHRFKNWVDILFQPVNKENERESAERKRTAAKEYYQFLYPIVMKKRSDPGEDIITDLLNVESEGERFTEDEVVRTTMLLLGAGIETTSHSISSAFYSFLHDDKMLYEELRSDLDLVPKAVEEMLRYRFHISKRHRTVKQDNHLLGAELKKGDLVIAWMSAANLDERVFENPFELNIHRSNNKKHLTFGNGPHFCLGAPLARLELDIALRGFLERFPRIEPVDSFELERNLVTSAPGQSLTQLPLRIVR